MFKIDMMRVRVDFYMDEFRKIWLLQIDKLFIRLKRDVPIEGTALLSKYIIKTMRKIEEIEKEEELEKEKEEAELSRQMELSKQASQLSIEGGT